MSTQARLPNGAEEVLESSVAQEVESFPGQIKLDLLRRRPGLAPGTDHRRVAGGNLGGLFCLEVPFVHEPLNDLVEHPGHVLVQLPALGRLRIDLAAEVLHHVLGELAGFEKGLENGLLERVHRPVAALGRFRPPGPFLGSAGEPGLEQEIAQLVQQRLEVDGIAKLGGVFAVGRVSHHL